MNTMISSLVSLLLSQLAPNVARAAVKAILDVVEQAVLDTETKLDDAIVLPIIRTIRETYELERD